MDRSVLRRWTLLSHLTDEELGNVEHVVVYGSDRYAREGHSALIVNKNGDVFATGYNSLLGRSSAPMPFADDEAEVLARHVKVDSLSGLGLKKIVVGFDFGAGLTANNELYVWGELDMSVKSESLVVMYECYTPGKSCSKCAQIYAPFLISPFTLNSCQSCNWFPTYTVGSPPPPDTPCRAFIFGNKVKFPCMKCGLKCSSLTVGCYDLNFCEFCKLLRERDKPKLLSPRKIDLRDSYRVTDIDCGRNFLVMKTVSCELLIWGQLGPCYYKGLVDSPNNVLITSFACGADHIAVLSCDGRVYTCGVGDRGQLGYKWTEAMGHVALKQVPTEWAVVKICCYNGGTVTMSRDGRVKCYSKVMVANMLGRSSVRGRFQFSTLNQASSLEMKGKFTDIVSSHLTKSFSARSEPSVLSWVLVYGTKRNRRAQFGVTDCVQALKDLPIVVNASRFDTPATAHAQTPPSTPFAYMYDNQLFSDFTFHLRDGNFPGHRVVLHSRSSHFKRFFDDNPLATTVDATQFPPRAYRLLLKYFYRSLDDDEVIEDLFQLHGIAVEYSENEIIFDVIRRLKDRVNEKTALTIYTKAEEYKINILVKECEPFMCAYNVWGSYFINE